MGKWLLGGCVIAVGGLFALLVAVGLYAFSTLNKENTLRNRFNAELKNNEIEFDKVWKVISQKAEITDSAYGQAKEFWAAYTHSGDGERGQAMFQAFVNKVNPKLPFGLSKNLMNTVESQRESFARRQRLMVDIKRQHDDVITSPGPGKFVVQTFGNPTPLELKVITSTHADDAFRTGRDDDIQLFKKKSPEKAKGN